MKIISKFVQVDKKSYLCKLETIKFKTCNNYDYNEKNIIEHDARGNNPVRMGCRR